MHETSIVNSIMRTLEMEFNEEKRNKMTEIHLKVGILSNIEPRLLQNAYSASQMMHPEYKNVTLSIESTPIKIKCGFCGETTMVQNYRFLCDTCERPSKNIIQGEEMLIHKVAFAD